MAGPGFPRRVFWCVCVFFAALAALLACFAMPPSSAVVLRSGALVWGAVVAHLLVRPRPSGRDLTALDHMAAVGGEDVESFQPSAFSGQREPEIWLRK